MAASFLELHFSKAQSLAPCDGASAFSLERQLQAQTASALAALGLGSVVAAYLAQVSASSHSALALPPPPPPPPQPVQPVMAPPVGAPQLHRANSFSGASPRWDLERPAAGGAAAEAETSLRRQRFAAAWRALDWDFDASSLAPRDASSHGSGSGGIGSLSGLIAEGGAVSVTNVALPFDEAIHGALRALARRDRAALGSCLERGRADLLRRVALAARHEGSSEVRLLFHFYMLFYDRSD